MRIGSQFVSCVRCSRLNMIHVVITSYMKPCKVVMCPPGVLKQFIGGVGFRTRGPERDFLEGGKVYINFYIT